LALDFGAFGLRGLGLLGSGLNGFGVGELNSMGSGPGDFNMNAGQDSLPWGPSPILRPTGSCALPR
jgi:hypothetical protein